MKIVHAPFRSSRVAGIFAFIILALGLLHPAPVHATPANPQTQPPILLNGVRVEIWPEYDKPNVLVIYHITLSSQVNLPAELSIRIPTAAGKPHAVAWQSTDNALYDLKYDPKSAGEWTELQFSTPAPNVQIEYYDPSLKKSDGHREFTFRWSGNYTVQNLSLQVQQPVNATNMTFRPSVGSGHTGNDGLTYYDLLEGKVNAGTTFDLVMSYDKPDDALTNSQFQDARPSQPVGPGTPGRVAFDQFLPWGVGGLGLLLIAAGSFWYWRTGRIPSAQTTPGRLRHTPARTRSVHASPAVASGEATFCHQCGNRAAAGDTFCRVCGTKLR